MLETLDYTIRIGSTPTILYFDLYLYSAYAAYYVYYNYFCLPVKNVYVVELTSQEICEMNKKLCQWLEEIQVQFECSIVDTGMIGNLHKDPRKITGMGL